MYIYDPGAPLLGFALSESGVERVLDFVTKWGRNASPFKIASLYLELNWKGISYWRDVTKAAKTGQDLLARIDELSAARAPSRRPPMSSTARKASCRPTHCRPTKRPGE